MSSYHDEWFLSDLKFKSHTYVQWRKLMGKLLLQDISDPSYDILSLHVSDQKKSAALSGLELPNPLFPALTHLKNRYWGGLIIFNPKIHSQRKRFKPVLKHFLCQILR